MKVSKSRFSIRVTAATGMLGALMLAFSYIESVVTALLPLPPGVKPGIANIIVMFACASMGFGCALLLTLIKSAFAVIISGITAGFISLSGGLLSVAVTALLIKRAYGRLSFTGISVLGAMCHNAGQTAAACIILGSLYYAAYFPVLVISAVITGAVTGTVLNCIMPSLKKLGLFDKLKSEKRNTEE